MMKETIVLYPSPGRSHLVPMIELGNLILTHYSDSFSVTIIISEAPFETSSTSQYIKSISATVPSINFHHLPTISTTATASVSDIGALYFELPRQNNFNFRQALLSLSMSSNIKAVIIDMFCNASFEILAALNIPTYYCVTASVTALSLLLYFPTLHKNTTKSFKELGDELFEIPGMLVPISAKDMPDPIQDRTSKVYNYFLETAIQITKSAGIVVNTIEPLEKKALEAILDGQCTPGKAAAPPVFCVGPLIVPCDGSRSRSGEEKHECMKWLDTQPKGSVVFLSFGSLGKLPAKQLIEMALGLETSGVRFLWVVRPPEDAVDASLDSLLPPGFLERTRDRGYVAKSWAPQVAVLSHESVGGFVTHCGWSSMLEGLRAGLPMLAWPLYAEQNLNKVVMTEVWKVALPVEREANGLVSAAQLEKRVTELIKSEKGKLIKERVMILKEHVLRALNEGGPSRVALDNLIRSIL